MSRKILRLHLAGYQQFADLTLDFTHPDTGEPLDRVCLIGANGTGKSTILRVLEALATGTLIPGTGEIEATLEADRRIERFMAAPPHAATLVAGGTERSRDGMVLRGPDGATWGPGLTVVCPAEATANVGMVLKGPPTTTLDKALERAGRKGRHVTVSTATIADMWSDLVAQVHARRAAREAFETLPENLEKTKAELIGLFDAQHPDPLPALASLWNAILEPAGLEFDAAGARVPVQLKDNLAAHVKVRGTDVVVPYGALSTGMRNFLFRIGHIFLTFFDLTVEDGVVLVDEPENSLFPDFLFTLMETYDAILKPHPVQLFVATHNPIVAAQFHPHERIVLEWEDGHVTARRGTAPKGDDPNDLLLKDFGLPHVMGPKGLEQWRRFQDLRRAIRQSNDESEKVALMEEAARIGREYGFGP